ncbi:MAG TPA: heparan-alpha-glucosaminide N-acetyltransferase domain-containing protein, partial [Prevotella sp.]
MQTTPTHSQRIEAIDILRGMTIAGMILVNNPGSNTIFAPLLHAEWMGLTPTDLVFPFFMFIMGITTYLSLKKYAFEWSVPCVRKIVKRALLLWFIGLAIEWLFMFCNGMISEEGMALPLGSRLWAAINTFGHIRLLGVLPRLGICYGLTALIAISMKHKHIPWLVAALFVGYFILLETGNGYAHDETNILAVADNAVLGSSHVFRWETPDPEGLLSTLPALGHVLIGFCVGRGVMDMHRLDNKIERLFLIGALLTFSGLLLSYACPISKKLWTPTFALTTCGMAATLLALLTWSIDKHGRKNTATRFFQVFGVNPLALYVLADVLAIPLVVCPLWQGQTIHSLLMDGFFSPLLPQKVASLTWSLLYVLLNWAFGYYLFKKKI